MICDALDAAGKADHDAAARDIQGAPLCGEAGGTGGGGGMESASPLDSSSTTGSAAVKLTLTIDWMRTSTPAVGSNSTWRMTTRNPATFRPLTSSFCHRGTPSTAGTPSSTTGDGGTFDAAAVEIDDGGEIGTADDDVVVISARSQIWIHGMITTAIPASVKL